MTSSRFTPHFCTLRFKLLVQKIRFITKNWNCNRIKRGCFAPLTNWIFYCSTDPAIYILIVWIYFGPGMCVSGSWRHIYHVSTCVFKMWFLKGRLLLTSSITRYESWIHQMHVFSLKRRIKLGRFCRLLLNRTRQRWRIGNAGVSRYTKAFPWLCESI